MRHGKWGLSLVIETQNLKNIKTYYLNAAVDIVGKWEFALSSHNAFCICETFHWSVLTSDAGENEKLFLSSMFVFSRYRFVVVNHVPFREVFIWKKNCVTNVDDETSKLYTYPYFFLHLTLINLCDMRYWFPYTCSS